MKNCHESGATPGQISRVGLFGDKILRFVGIPQDREGHKTYESVHEFFTFVGSKIEYRYSCLHISIFIYEEPFSYIIIRKPLYYTSLIYYTRNKRKKICNENTTVLVMRSCLIYFRSSVLDHICWGLNQVLVRADNRLSK